MSQFAPKRKQNRIDYDYSTQGYYFITICTKDRKKILSTVGVALQGDPIYFKVIHRNCIKIKFLRFLWITFYINK